MLTATAESTHDAQHRLHDNTNSREQLFPPGSHLKHRDGPRRAGFSPLLPSEGQALQAFPTVGDPDRHPPELHQMDRKQLSSSCPECGETEEHLQVKQQQSDASHLQERGCSD